MFTFYTLTQCCHTLICKLVHIFQLLMLTINIHNYHLKGFIKQNMDLNRETKIVWLSISHVQGLAPFCMPNKSLSESSLWIFSPPYVEGKFLIAETHRNYIQWPIKSKTQRKTKPVIGLKRYWFQGAPRRGAVILNEGCVETDGTLLYVRFACAQTFQSVRSASTQRTRKRTLLKISDWSFPAPIRLPERQF